MRALLAIADPASVDVLSRTLAGNDLDLEFCTTISDALSVLGRKQTYVVFCQARLSDGSFRDLLRFTDRQHSESPVIVCSDFYDKTTYIEAMSLGAFDYLAFPYRRTEVEWVIGNALRRLGEMKPSPAPAAAQHARSHTAHAV